MQIINLSDVPQSQGSVFLDNIVLCSADRLLSGSYESVRGNRLFTKSRSTAATLILHDLINLSILVESLLACNVIYVNAEFVDRWNSDIASGSLTELSSHVIGVAISRDVRWEAESNVVRNPFWGSWTRPGVSITHSLLLINSPSWWRTQIMIAGPVGSAGSPSPRNNCSALTMREVDLLV